MIKKSLRLALRITTFVISAFLLVAVTLILAKAMAVRKGPDLEWWHTEIISSEFRVEDKKHPETFDEYLEKEAEVFRELQGLVDAADLAQGLSRFRIESEAYPVKSGGNLNRSSEKRPAVIKGGVLLLHGMTDSPYTLRHLADMFYRQGFYVLNLRLPGHGTIPGELDRMQWQDWLAAVELAATHVSAQIVPGQPFYILGYSNGGSLALKYTMDALEDAVADSTGDSTGRIPDRVFLLSPMIAVDALARFSRLFYWLGRIEFFRHSRWLEIIPEYDPHKYNSFPMNAGLQSYKLTTAVKTQIQDLASSGQLKQMPPVLTFQSLVDKTVVTSAIRDYFYENLPANGSELVLFDVNRLDVLDEFVLPRHGMLLNRTMNEASGNYAISVLTNRSGDDRRVLELRQAAGPKGFVDRTLDYAWPEDVYSLTHVALPFPLQDEVYGLEPPAVDMGYPDLGRVQMLGEGGALILSPTLLQRLRSNPFYGYIEERIESVIHQDL